MSGNNQNNNVWRVGIGYSASTYPGQTARINVLCPRYTGNPTVGVPGSINAPAKMVLKYALKASDTAVNYIKIVPPAPIQVPAGEKFGVFCTFIAGYAYNPLTQVYYRCSLERQVKESAIHCFQTLAMLPGRVAMPLEMNTLHRVLLGGTLLIFGLPVIAPSALMRMPSTRI